MDTIVYAKSNGELDPEDKQVMIEGMLSYHASKGHPRKVEHFSITIKRLDKQLIGIVMASFLWNGMEIDSLWVDEAYRGQGLGSKLMGLAEAEGIKRGCHHAYTNTSTWQAPEFYKKLGYEVIGKIDNFPEGNCLTYFCKTLIDDSSRQALP